MANIIERPAWHIPERMITPEPVYLKRRDFLQQMGFIGAAGLLAAPLIGCTEAQQPPAPPTPKAPGLAAKGGKLYPAARNPEFNAGWKLSDEEVAGTYNNFYEFSTTKERVHQLTGKFVTSPWPVQIDGLVEKPLTLDIQELIAMMGLEERVYRFRCVEAWSMVVPWTGFQFSKLVERVAPKAGAKFVRFETAAKPDQMPAYARLKAQGYPMPYNEGLRLEEAMNPLTLVTTGIFGKPLPKQHGAPVRMIVPWKYGYKSIKSITRIEFVAKQPATLWETLAPDEYPFESNVNPAVPHPRWSQATERVIDTGDRIRTQPYNGYASFVAKLYSKG